jgi:cation/acetate symporter
VAHLVALAFAVAASANLPVVLLTLYWKKCNTAGVVAGLVIGTVSAIALVLVSPNMTYPRALTASAQKVVDAAPARMAKLEADAAAATDPAAKATVEKALAGAKKDLAGAEDTLKKYANDTTSLVGLEKPLFPLKNPGIVSIPLGFLAVFVFSLFYRDERAAGMWDELYVRSNTGLGRAAAAAH